MGMAFPEEAVQPRPHEHTTSQDRRAEEASGMTGRQLFCSGGPSCRHASRGRKRAITKC